MLTYILNNTVLEDNLKFHIKYSTVNQDDDNESCEGETFEQKYHRILNNKIMTDEQIINSYKIVLTTDHENRIADESTFVISLL
jgi:hypothetical protein